MLHWAFIFLVIALVAALLGFGGIADVSATVAQVLFGIFLLAVIVTVVLFIAAVVGVRRWLGP